MPLTNRQFLVVDFQFLAFECQVIDLLAQTMPFDKEFVRQRMDAEGKLRDYGNFISGLSRQADNVLEEKLAESYKLRRRNWELMTDALSCFIFLIKNENLQKPVEALDEFDAFCKELVFLDQVIYDVDLNRINSLDDLSQIPERIKRACQQLLTFANENKALIERIIQKKNAEEMLPELQSFFGRSYQQAFRLQESILLWMAWIQVLDNFKEHAKGSGYRYAYQLLHGVLGQERQFSLEFFRANRKNPSVIILELNKMLEGQPDVSPDRMILFLQSKRQDLVKEAKTIVSKLKNYSHLSGALAHASQLWMGTSYVQYGELVCKLYTETIRPTFRPDEAHRIIFFDILGPAFFMVVLDGLLPRYLTGSVSPCLYLSMVNTLLSPSFDWLLKAGNKLHLREREMTLFMQPFINQVMGWMLGIGVNACRAGFGWGTTAYFSVNFLFGSLVRSGVGWLMDASSKDEQKKEALFIILKIIGEYLGSLLGQGIGNGICQLSEPYVRPLFFKPPPAETLLTDRRLCFIYPRDCRKAALSILGLGPNAMWKEIKAAYHQRAREYHPDSLVMESPDPEKFRQVSAAYRLLSLLFDSKERHRVSEDPSQNDAPLIIFAP